MSEERRHTAFEPLPDARARVALIERSILVLLVVGLFIGVLAVVKPFTTAILFGAALATAAWPVPQALVRRGLRRGAAAAILLSLSFVILVLPMLLFAPHLAHQLILIWGGAAWWLFGQDQQAWRAFMIVWGLFVGMIDNFIKPWLIGFGIEMPTSLTILGAFGGSLGFGFLGLFIGPTLIAIMFTLL
jgi:predicted PurR-regulated permease PerM